MAVAFTECQGSPTEDKTPMKFKAQRKLKCAWTDRLTLMQELEGTAYSPYPAATCIHTAQDPVDGLNLGTGENSAYEFATIIADYETPNFSGGLSAESFAESITPFSRYLLLDSGDYCFSDAIEFDTGVRGDKPQGESVGLLFSGCEYTHTKFAATIVPDVQQYLDHVNSVAITPKKSDLARHWNFAIGTLLFCAASIEEVSNRPGRWKIVYKCKYQPEGWNVFLNPRTGLFVGMVRCLRVRADQVPPYHYEDELLWKHPEFPFEPYQSANFSSLFNV